MYSQFPTGDLDISLLGQLWLQLSIIPAAWAFLWAQIISWWQCSNAIWHWQRTISGCSFSSYMLVWALQNSKSLPQS